MHVDLGALRAMIEEELEKLEQRRALLHKQLEHVEAVQQLAEKTQVTSRGAQRTEATDPGKKDEASGHTAWFRRP